ncbi:hypothetical protein HOLleu_42100 [Holothuria leucospilota]|uniref:Uncharacterized protein n=1 Tax=Holothuria leucospilota TaxID=206669 RepID=A0A9Q1BAA8_HOLLE|nr:hypothetical protein HOLleu_42100 [Holothuria leucospilota]
MCPNNRNDKACREFIDSIADNAKQTLAAEIFGAKDSGEIKPQLADIVELKSAAADGVLCALEAGITEVGLKDIESAKQKIVGCNFDEASVNMGKHNGVATKLKQKLGHHIVPLHCVAHNLEFAVLDAVGKNVEIRRFNENREQHL